MNEPLDMETIYREERRRWMREEAPRPSFRDIVADSVPYWIVIVALVLFGLSAPHTAEIFNMLTPGWGFIAPVGVEFGLLYAAFRRRLAKAQQHSLPWTLWAMEILLFVTAILVNGAGSFVSVVAANSLESLSFSAIATNFDALPATSQAALIMAALAAFIIPIGTLVAGDGLADLTLERRERIDFRERHWQEAEFTVVYRAVFVRYMQAGLDERDARRRSLSEVKGYLVTGRPSAVRLLSEGNGQAGQRGHRANEYGGVKERVREYLDTYPELEGRSVNQVLSELHSAGVKAGRTTVAEVLAERRNGE